MLAGILVFSVPARTQTPKSPTLEGGTACSLRSRCSPFDPHVGGWQSPPPTSVQRLKIALDPGHGGDEPGAIGARHLVEKDASRALAEALRGVLLAAGYDVLLTREGDATVDRQDRAKVANAAEADLFVSLHFNASRATSAKGSEVFFLSLGQGDEDARAVAETENAGQAGATTDVVAGILDNLAQQAFLQDSERLAVAIQAQLNALGGIRQRGVKQAPFAVLRRAAMPAVLVEAAFISNPKEAAKVSDPVFRKKLAEAIARGIRRFLASASGPVRRKAYVDPK
jgi:N-acetylmuramoyl-L-alanine amidase